MSHPTTPALSTTGTEEAGTASQNNNNENHNENENENENAVILETPVTAAVPDVAAASPPSDAEVPEPTPAALVTATAATTEPASPPAPKNNAVILETQETAAVPDVAAAPPPSVAVVPAPTPAALVTATAATTEPAASPAPAEAEAEAEAETSTTTAATGLPRTPAAAAASPRRTRTRTTNASSSTHQRPKKRLTGHLPPVSIRMRKKLATHIEKAGGIQKIKGGKAPGTPQRLWHLLNQHPKVYPPTGDPVRRQISQLVFRWTQLDDKGQYVERVLNRLGVKSAANMRRSSSGGANSILQNDDDDDDDDDDDTSDDSNKNTTGTTSRSKKVNKKKRKRKAKDNKKSSSSSEEEEEDSSTSSDSAANRKRHAKKKAKAKKRKSKKKRVYSSSSSDDDADEFVSTSRVNDKSSSLPKRTKRIKVDIDNPEWNDEVMIFTIKDIKGASGNSLFSGYYLMLPMDIRWCMVNETEDVYKARVFNRNSVLITLPAFPYSLLNLVEGTNLTRYVPDEVKNGLNDARRAFDADKANRQWKHLLLEFPSGHCLSAKEIFQDAGKDEELDLEIVPFKYKAQGRKCLENWACWKVARVDVGSRKAAGSGGKSRALALLDHLFVNSDDSDDLDEESGVV